MNEQFFCGHCHERTGMGIVELDTHLRCEVCGSDAVVALECLRALERTGGRNGDAKNALHRL